MPAHRRTQRPTAWSPHMNATRLTVPSLLLLTTLANAQPGTEITYQGRLENNGVPANGTFDMRFTLHSAHIGGAIIDGPVCRDNVFVTDGLFTTTIDFNPSFFSLIDLWLEISVRADSTPSNCMIGTYTP